jgi:hypothetical protein
MPRGLWMKRIPDPTPGTPVHAAPVMGKGYWCPGCGHEPTKKDWEQGMQCPKCLTGSWQRIGQEHRRPRRGS